MVVVLPVPDLLLTPPSRFNFVPKMGLLTISLSHFRQQVVFDFSDIMRDGWNSEPTRVSMEVSN